MEHNRQINAIYNQQTIRVYQAYCPRIALREEIICTRSNRMKPVPE